MELQTFKGKTYPKTFFRPMFLRKKLKKLGKLGKLEELGKLKKLEKLKKLGKLKKLSALRPEKLKPIVIHV